VEEEQARALGDSCTATLNARDPAADARTAFRAGDTRFLAWETDGYAPRLRAPGFEHCVPVARNVSPRGLPRLPLGYALLTDVVHRKQVLMSGCYGANREYGAAFNAEMLRLAPAAMRTSCRPTSAASRHARP
jgi:hypothetical protein